MRVQSEIVNDTTKCFPRTLHGLRTCSADEAVAVQRFKTGGWKWYMRGCWIFVVVVGIIVLGA